MTLLLPRTFHDGANEIASGKQVMENLNVLKTALDPLWGSTSFTRVNNQPLVSEQEYELSATRPGFVLLQVPENGNQPFVNVYVGGVALPAWVATGAEALPTTYGPFPVPAGQKWKAVFTLGGGSIARYWSWAV